jgi:hypothetical protein
MIESLTTGQLTMRERPTLFYPPTSPHELNRVRGDFLLKITLALSVRLGYLSRPLS